MKILCVLLIVTNVMYSQISNNLNQKVESLNDSGNMLQFRSDGSITGEDGAFRIPLDAQRVYQINRVDLIVNNFYWVILPDIQAVAFPKWNQFTMYITLSASIRNETGTTIRKKLFNDLHWTTPDGITSTKVLYEPFVFETDINNDNILYISVTNFQSVFDTLTGIPLPPESGEVFARGTIFLEGISYPNPDKPIFQRHSK